MSFEDIISQFVALITVCNELIETYKSDPTNPELKQAQEAKEMNSENLI